jgi:DNA-binding NtrC family response regulator
MTPPKILIIDDTPTNISVLSDTLEPYEYEIFAASKAEQGIKLATTINPDVILLDIVMPGKDGFSVCKTLKADPATKDIPIIFLTAVQEIGSLLRGFELGAVDYISKPFRMAEVLARIKTHSDNSRLSRELKERNRQLEDEMRRRRTAENDKQVLEQRLSNISDFESQRLGVKGLIGKSPEAQRICSEIERLKNFPTISVLVMGESGTGKELVARSIHYGSIRKDGPFIPVNCAAIPAELTESVFFGHRKGSFTGAIADRKGCFELADGGTLFLDEIGDMDLLLQAKLLRVLEDGEFVPVGGTQLKKVDVRVVAATNADLSAKIAAGRFRQDLYFRLARYVIQTIPLRKRREDIALISNHFLSTLAAEMGMPPRKITPEAQERLNRYSFPGNVRELRNVIERALIESVGKTIAPEHLYLMPENSVSTASAFNNANTQLPSDPQDLNFKVAEENLIRRALEESGGNISEAAKRLGMHRSRLYRRIQSKDS